MGSTTVNSDCVIPHQNGIPNGTSKRHLTETNTSRPMNFEEYRLETFKGKWPVQAPVPAERLAKAGFYYTGHDMEVTCFSCGGCIGEWDYGDIAIEKHKRFFGTCNFVNNTSNNIPYTSQSNSKTRSCSGEFNPGIERSVNMPYKSRGPLLDFENLVVNGDLDESRPTPNGNINDQMAFSGNSAFGASVTYQEGETTQHDPNRTKGIFMSGNSGVGARVIYNNQEVNRSTGHQPITRNSKGIFMSGNSGVGATVTYKEFNVNNQPIVENSLNSERNSSSSSPSVNVGMQRQAVPSSREQFINPGTSSTNNIFPGASTQPVHNQVNTSEVPRYQGDENMKYEAERLKSFNQNWPLTFISPYDLAKAGFYYMLQADICKCAFCKGVLANWQMGDMPIREHHRNFPLCPFVMGLDVGNVPSYSGDVERLRNSSSSGRDECGLHSYEETFNVPERGTRILQSPNGDEESGGVRHKGPMHVSQGTIEARLRSFQSWPLWSPIKAERLAEAGFFYIGIRDHTKCFYCDIGLCNWEPGDDPWIEHGRWSKNCAFVLLLKGEDFVNSCQVIAASPHTGENHKYSEFGDEPPSPFSSAVDEAMRSSLVQNVLKTKVYPSVLIRRALLRKFQDTGRGVSNVNELSEAVMVEMEESWRNRSMPTTEMQTPVVVRGSVTNGPVENTCNNVSVNCGTVIKPETELTTEEKLEQVKQQSQENRLCKICMDREIEVAFIPCGHQLACRHCALALKDCAICRKPVERFLRIFLP